MPQELTETDIFPAGGDAAYRREGIGKFIALVPPAGLGLQFNSNEQTISVAFPLSIGFRFLRGWPCQVNSNWYDLNRRM